MANIALIHGYAVGLTSPGVRPPYGKNAGMSAFDSSLRSGEASVFHWGLTKEVSFFQLLNPFFLRDYYKAECRAAEDIATHEELKIFLEQEQPRAIVCHSMGSVLLDSYLHRFVLPNSVRVLVFVQSDLPATISITTSVPLYNFFCPWDPTLLLSSLYHGAWRAGVKSMRVPSARNNIFFPLTRPINLHTSSIRDPKFSDFIHTFLQS